MKRFSFLLVFVALMLTACMPTSAETVPTPAVEAVTEESHKDDTREDQPSLPSEYILVKVTTEGGHGSNHYFASLFFYGQKVCEWDLYNTPPWERDEDLLYFTPENCGLDPRNGVIWHISSPSEEENSYGEIVFDGRIIGEIPVWILVGTEWQSMTK